MRLDEARIVIRERTVSERLDLALHLLRRHAAPLALLWALGVLPFALLNGWLSHRYALVAHDAWTSVEAAQRNPVYFTLLAGLVFLQAPLATSLMTVYLGKAAFVDTPRLGEVFREWRSTWWQNVLCLGLVRCSLPVTFVLCLEAAAVERDASWTWLFLGGGCAIAALTRCVRPFLGEVILLERNPFWSQTAKSMTVARRNANLHASSGGEQVAAFLSITLISVLSVLVLFGAALYLQGLILSEQRAYSWGMLHLAWPASLWLVAGFVAVFRYLSYLDLRIRHEGWEVDLLLRAEGTRWGNPSFTRP